MFDSLARSLEIAVATNVGECLQLERRNEIPATVPFGPKRLLSRFILSFANRYPAKADTMLDKLAQTRGYSYLGSGYEFSVYQELGEDMVTKVHRRSAGMSEAERSTLILEKEFGHEVLRDHLGTIMLGQSVYIGEHVLGTYQTVQIKQPLVEFRATDAPFEADNLVVDPQRLSTLLSAYPGVDNALRDFVTASKQLHEKTGFLPDTAGANNLLAQAGGNLVLLDSTPIEHENTYVQSMVLSQLDSLTKTLADVA